MSLPDREDQVLLLHNARCSKSRATEALLQEQGTPFHVRAYLEDSLSRAELEELRERLGRPVREWIRTGQKEYAAAGLDANSDEDRLLDAIAAEPILMERPIVVRGKRAVVGRPPTDVLDLFE